MSRWASLLLAACAVLAISAPANARGGGEPSALVIQLSYAVSDDGSSPHEALQAFAGHTESLSFKTGFGNARAQAEARYEPNITDTDLRGQASHPWALTRKGGGRKVLALIGKSLEVHGKATVNVRAVGAGGVDRARLTIDVADCAQDPPLYPLDCEIHPRR